MIAARSARATGDRRDKCARQPLRRSRDEAVVWTDHGVTAAIGIVAGGTRVRNEVAAKDGYRSNRCVRRAACISAGHHLRSLRQHRSTNQNAEKHPTDPPASAYAHSFHPPNGSALRQAKTHWPNAKPIFAPVRNLAHPYNVGVSQKPPRIHGQVRYDLLLSIFAFVLGATVGSFLNVCIYRWPVDLSINRPRRSFCPNCKQPISWYQNLPLIAGWRLAANARIAAKEFRFAISRWNSLPHCFFLRSGKGSRGRCRLPPGFSFRFWSSGHLSILSISSFRTA